MASHPCLRVLLGCLLAASSAAQQEPDPQWLLVRGETGRYAKLSMERIGKVYLGRFRCAWCRRTRPRACPRRAAW